MKRLVVVGVVVAVLAVVADFMARAYAEGRIEAVAERRGGVSTSAEAAIGSFPFLPGLLGSGNAGRLNVHITGFVAGRLRIAAIDIDIDDLRVDQSKLLQREGVEVTAIRDTTVAVELTGPDLASATRLPVTIRQGEVRISVAGQSVAVTPTITAGGSLSLGGAGVGASALGLESTGLTACTSTGVEVQGDRLRITCTTDEIPPVLVRSAQRRP
ncbi:MAG: LmeA family phospholipid-binding protein [Actinobacteria bacterium]|nr:LmeA family phospholipid-binding protein [Actinomycetota bacterium]MBW3650568.1 LmeA family phospholipid-binding protein [Actinomycetota bacterium]